MTSRKVPPTAMTRRRLAVRTTMVSSTEMAHREHGFTPSTNPMTSVETSSELAPRSTSPSSGTSTTVREPVSHVSVSWEHVPAPGVP
ncbi:hypothetical protein [Actinotalea sp. Marseille-Q4924]|uniref:hypothetical protein n=1 Tax=Actinotalea sp. Marseille-Q4924 TaxID=2866571 RepID=UPI001CE4750F|nr:hypothetical protein [Actinotalea sp. Marseille-Q4924]